MNLVNIVLQGNLTKDASFTKFLDKEKAVYNFTIACNTAKDKVFYADCSYWINYKEGQENSQKKLFDENLKKGKNITIYSDYLETRESTGKDGTKYNNVLFTVKNIFLTSSPQQVQQEENKVATEATTQSQEPSKKSK